MQKIAVTRKAPEGRAVPVTLRAVIQRINRKLAQEEQVLRTARGDRWFSDLGNYYVVNLRNNTVVFGHVDPEAWARELGVLKPYERVEE